MGQSFLIFMAAVGFMALVLILIYNTLVSRRNDVDNAFATIDVQLKMRYDLIPNLVSTVKEYMQHERSTLEQVTSLRAKALRPDMRPDETVRLDNQIGRALTSIMVSAENYPDLKANENFKNLQLTLMEVEGQVAAARRNYNSAVTIYNTSLQTFPTAPLAQILHFYARELFQANSTERANVDISKLFNQK